VDDRSGQGPARSQRGVRAQGGCLESHGEGTAGADGARTREWGWEGVRAGRPLDGCRHLSNGRGTWDLQRKRAVVAS